MQDFSYRAYKTLISAIVKKIPLLDFSHIHANTERFFVLRHDVEFSVEKAYELAKFEKEELDITSSYFFSNS